MNWGLLVIFCAWGCHSGLLLRSVMVSLCAGWAALWCVIYVLCVTLLSLVHWQHLDRIFMVLAGLRRQVSGVVGLSGRRPLPLPTMRTMTIPYLRLAMKMCAKFVVC